MMIELLLRLLCWLLAVCNLPVDLAESILLLGFTIWSRIILARDCTPSVAFRIWHFVASGAALLAYLFEPGLAAASFAAVWLLWVFWYVLKQCRAFRFRSERYVERSVAAGFLVVSATWFVCARYGFSPFNFPLGITLLTSIHFFFGGWLTPMLIDRFLFNLERMKTPNEGRHLNATRNVGTFALRMSLAAFPMVAIGMLCEPNLELLGVILLIAAVGVFLLLQLRWSLHQPAFITRSASVIATACGFIAFSLAATYAVAEYRHAIAITIPQMVATHGLLASVGMIGGLLVATRNPN